jgi:hypothetical protein
VDPGTEEDGSGEAADRGRSPVALSLEAASRHREGVAPPPFCPDLGRHLLLAQSSWSDWVLRRVETVRFQEDRNVVREVTVEFRVRADAPVFTEDGKDCWLVPLALLWRRTLVEFQISDEDDHRMTQPGLRLTQQVDQSVLLAAAAAVPLSSVRQPRRALGASAAQLLFEEIAAQGDHHHRQVVFQPELVVRASSDRRRG